MSNCLSCKFYKFVDDKGHLLSKHVVKTGYDGFCRRRMRCVLEFGVCRAYRAKKHLRGRCF